MDWLIWTNVGSYAALNEPWEVESAFTEMNTELPVYGPYDKTEAARFDRFIAINTADYQALELAWQVDSRFLELNANPEASHTEPTSYTEASNGPR